LCPRTFALDRFLERGRHESPPAAAWPVARVLRITETRSPAGTRSRSSPKAIASQRATSDVENRGVTIAYDAPLLSDSDPALVEQLGEQIADIAAGIHAATYQLLVLLHEFDERKGWNNGFLSCAHWLSWRTSIDPGAAREKVRVARALPHLPLLSGALQRGEISYAKVRALTRIATPATEERLLVVAYHGTAAQVERLVRGWRRCDRQEDVRKQLARSVTCYVDEDGMVILRARLTPEQGGVVQKALEAASDRLYQQSRHAAEADNLSEEVTSAQRRADALALMAESALDADLDSGSAADRYQVVLRVEPGATDTLEPPPIVELADGPISVLCGNVAAAVV
jgi:hypothetical protein